MAPPKLSEIAAYSDEDCVSYLIEKSTLVCERLCPKCNNPMKLNLDTFLFRCNRKQLSATGCNIKRSLLKNTFFSNSKLSISKIFQIIYFWYNQTPQQNVAETLDIDKNTVSSWFRKILIAIPFIKFILRYQIHTIAPILKFISLKFNYSNALNEINNSLV